jgi:transposase
LDFVGASRDRKSPKATRRRRPHIKKLRRLAAHDGLDLWSIDECHFEQHGTRCRMWVPPEEKDPFVLQAPTRRSVALFGAVNLRDGRMVSLLTPTFDALSFEAFLALLWRHRRRGRPMVIVTDNAPYHRSDELEPFLQSHRGLRLDFLPPYSPQLNPIERVWKLLRRLCTHNVYFATLEELTDAVCQQLIHWSKPNAILQKLCCII